MRPRPLALLLAAAAVLGACGGADPRAGEPPPTDAGPTAPPSTAPTSPRGGAPDAWDELFAEVHDDGTVTPDTARRAFSLAVAPLPGVATPVSAGEPEPSGTFAVRWVVQHWDALDLAQRRAVAGALGDGGSTGAGRSAARTTGCYGQPLVTADGPGTERFRQVVDRVTPQLEAALGGAIRLSMPVYLVARASAAAGDTSSAYTWVEPVDCEGNAPASCTIHVNPKGVAAGGAELDSILAHEVMHCLVFQRAGVAAYDLPGWIGEGLPAWAGETVAGGSAMSRKWWKRYLTRPAAPLAARTYDAIGFYAHLARSGRDPWVLAPALLDAFETGPAFELAVGSDPASVLDAWPSGFAREPSRGAAWDTSGPGIWEVRAEIPTRRLRNGGRATVPSPALAGGLGLVDLQADVVVLDAGAGFGRLVAAGGHEVVFSATPTAGLCTRPGGCTCADGRANPELAVVSAGPALVAVTGGRAAATAGLHGVSLADYCGRAPEPPAPAPVDACLVGSWTSTGVTPPDLLGGLSAELGGGDGARLRIAPDGEISLDLATVNPQVEEIGGNLFGIDWRGRGSGRITAEAGRVSVLEDGFRASTAFVVLSGRGAGQEQAGTHFLGDGSYACTSDTLTLTVDSPLGGFVVAYRRD